MLLYPNAKINIGLDITEKRPDGYHNLETIFYPIGLSDVLQVEKSETCTDYSFSASGIKIDGDPDENLIVKAYHLLKNDYDLSGIDISLIKNIPFGAGLGGGSSDAAFMLIALNELFELDIEAIKLEEYAVKIGADCPVFIQNKPVFATGIGNIFENIDLTLQGKYLVLIKPDIHVSTPLAYSLVKPKQPEVSIKESIQKPLNEWKNLIKNDFETSVFSKYPEIAQIKQRLYTAGAEYASMSGSGSSVYGIFDEKPKSIAGIENYFVAEGFLD